MKHASDPPTSPPREQDCRAVRVQASAWIDGELADAGPVRAHLEACAACRSHVEELRALHARFAPLRADEPVADLWPAIAARARAPRSEPSWPARARRVAAALIGCAGTAALLQAGSQLAPPSPAESGSARPRWPAALHSAAAFVIRQNPEQRLLAAIEPRQEDEK